MHINIMKTNKTSICRSLQTLICRKPRFAAAVAFPRTGEIQFLLPGVVISLELFHSLIIKLLVLLAGVKYVRRSLFIIYKSD